ncbi:MAG: tetratricopeptide repeat protein [Deltaproteobacteria bacterium]|nr:tetratricopeptide repeat protein [Deltaproteobacteria bacterium]
MPSLDQLLAIAGKSKKPLPWYGVAMEYRSLGRPDDAVATFQKVHEIDPRFVAAYFMCAQVHAERGEAESARAELEAGMTAARAVGDAHAEAEMRELLETLT